MRMANSHMITFSQWFSCSPNLPFWFSCADHEFVHINPVIGPVETTRLDEVREFRVDIQSFPAPKVTWLKDRSVLGDVAAEITTNLLKINETRWLKNSAFTYSLFFKYHILYLCLNRKKFNHINIPFKSVALKLLFCLFSYQGVLTLIRAKAEDSGNYTIRAETGSQSASNSFYLQVKGGTFSFFCSCRLFLSHLCLPTFACVCFCLCFMFVHLAAPLYLS